MPPSSYRLSRYLKAKQTVDERALNRRVEKRFYTELEHLASSKNGPIAIVDLGAGLGPTAQRLVRAIGSTEIRSITYHLVDQSSALLQEARTRLQDWIKGKGFDVQESPNQIHCSREDQSITFQFHGTEALQYLSSQSTGQFDSVIAQSFIDLVNIPKTLTLLPKTIRKEGIAYFPLTFDGQTRFLSGQSGGPAKKIIEYYHESMDRNTDNGPTGGPESGAQLLEGIPEIGAFLAVGSSDWLVYPQEDIGYEGDEAYFLYHILRFVERELSSAPRLSTDTLSEWITDKREDVANERLIYQASQLDVLARVGDSSGS
jgi:hypothetical protein